MRDDKLWPIDTDDDVERLARHCGWGDNRRYMTPTDYAIWCERMRKFAALAALQREQWIPVSERLPEKEQYPVLVAHQSGAVRMVFGIEPFIEGDWMGYYEPTLQGRFLRGITHWMPLPPAPQPEETESFAGETGPARD